jgi:hypothetical protein
MLQNHPGEKTFPVSNDWSPKASLRLTPGESALAHGMLTLAVISLGLAGLTSGIVSEADGPFPEGELFAGACAAVGLLCVLVLLHQLWKGATRRVKEQRLYYEVAGIPESYPEDCREALQLDGVNALDAWSETLECWPCERRLQASQARFQSFTLTSMDEAKTALDEDWGVLTREDYDRVVKELMEGLHTRGFLLDSLSDDRQALFQRLSALTDLPVREIESLVSSRFEDDCPPRLIWAWDWWRVIPLSRNAFMAGLIPEELAWENILTVSNWVHALFDDLPSYHRNLRVGHAYWSNNFAAAQSRKTVLDTYEKNTYPRPIRDVAWRRRPKELLPMTALKGLQRERETSEDPALGTLLN